MVRAGYGPRAAQRGRGGVISALHKTHSLEIIANDCRIIPGLCAGGPARRRDYPADTHLLSARPGPAIDFVDANLECSGRGLRPCRSEPPDLLPDPSAVSAAAAAAGAT